jgi:hypothetical protein
MAIFCPSQNKSPLPIKAKFGTTDYVKRVIEVVTCKLHRDRISKVATPRIDEVFGQSPLIRYLFSFCFSDAALSADIMLSTVRLDLGDRHAIVIGVLVIASTLRGQIPETYCRGSSYADFQFERFPISISLLAQYQLLQRLKH